MILQSFANYIRGLLRSPGEEAILTLDEIASYANTDEANRLGLYLLAINSATNLIANCLSKCEIRTFVKGEEKYGAEYYLWNYEPNVNQCASTFIQKIVWRLLMRGECLVVPDLRDGLLVAASYHHERYANRSDVFSGVTVDLDHQGSYQINRDFRSEDVLFYRLNNSNIAALLKGVMEGYGKLLEAATDNAIRTYGEHGILKIEAKANTATYGKKEDGTSRTFGDVYREMMTKQFKDYFKAPNAVMPLFEGFEYKPSTTGSSKSTSDVKDVAEVADEIYGKVASAFQIPACILKGDVADLDKPAKHMLTFAIDPIAKMMERENNRKRNGKAVLKGTYQMIDTSKAMHREPLDAAKDAFNLIGSGWSIDEVRKLTGDAPLNTEWSDKHYISLNFTQYEEAGANNAEEAKNGTKTGNDT